MQSNLSVRVTFSDGLDANQNLNDFITVSGGTLGEFSPSDEGKVYTATFTPLSDAKAVAKIQLDTNWTAGGNTPINPVFSPSIAVDTDIPSVNYSFGETTNFEAGETYTVSFTFSESVKEFGIGNLEIDPDNFGSISNLEKSTADPRVYTAEYTAQTTADPSLALKISAGWTDVAGNAPTPLPSGYIVESQDNIEPEILGITSDIASIGPDDKAIITIEFSELPVGLSKDSIKLVQAGTDLKATSAVVRGFGPSAENPLTWTAFVEGIKGAVSQDVQVQIGQNAFSDLAGNKNTSGLISEIISVTTIRPEVVQISLDKSTYSSGEVGTLTVTFSTAIDPGTLTEADLRLKAEL